MMTDFELASLSVGIASLAVAVVAAFCSRADMRTLVAAIRKRKS
jgi:hypothetical protein